VPSRSRVRRLRSTLENCIPSLGSMRTVSGQFPHLAGVRNSFGSSGSRIHQIMCPLTLPCPTASQPGWLTAWFIMAQFISPSVLTALRVPMWMWPTRVRNLGLRWDSILARFEVHYDNCSSVVHSSKCAIHRFLFLSGNYSLPNIRVPPIETRQCLPQRPSGAKIPKARFTWKMSLPHHHKSKLSLSRTRGKTLPTRETGLPGGKMPIF
jgi:hypothetical protein